MKRYNKRNCQDCVRGSFVDKYGRRITIMGIHAHEYTIYITVDFVSAVTVESYPSGQSARKRFNELKRKR